jgi:tetratricopeptide (TPR) repeat protein
VYLHVDAEKGEGKEVAERYKVNGFPTFLLVNSDGDLLDQWSGYEGADAWVETLESAVKDPITVDARLARFRAKATESDAAKLADLRMASGFYAEANALYQQAAYLNPMSKTNYHVASFKAVTKGAWTHVYNVNQVKSAADEVLNAKNTSGMDLMMVAKTMGKVASMSGEADLHVPYLRAAFEGTENSMDKTVQKYRSYMAADYALHVQKDVNKAVELKKTNMAEGWMENATQLNNFAWWCYENRINMDEGEKLARRGVGLAEAGTDKANILDTLAELCNAKGDCGDAVELIEMALAEAPESKYFAKQLSRFQEQLAQQN